MNQQSEIINQIDVTIDEITSAIKGTAKLSLHNTSYETGLLGYSLYFAFLAKYKNKKKYITRAEEYFEKSISALDIHNFQRIYDTDSIDAHLSHIGRFVAVSYTHLTLPTICSV